MTRRRYEARTSARRLCMRTGPASTPFAFWSRALSAMNRPEPIGAPPFRDSLPEPKPGSLSARARAAVGPQAAAYLAGLNPEQRQAVEATEGPVLVLAGAGTGKTRVLTTRIAHLIATAKARPFDILAVTFTNKAAREMKERVGALVGSIAEGMPWLGTFHSIGTKVLRRHAELVGLKSDFTILGVDDQLLECLRLWRDNPEVLGLYQNRFRYMLVDEYQDTNVAQYLWLRLLAQTRKNLCCVGDDDQSIYGWRGAEVDNILRFEHDFPGAKVIRLERNYRSTGHILDAASTLIAKNQGRLGKTLRTEDVAGEKVTVTGAWDSEEEARLVGEEIEALHANKHDLSEIAILVRISAQMREIEDRLVQTGTPYRVIGGPRFYERAEIRDALAYLRATANPADDLAFERIINVPKRGLADATLNALHAHARAARAPIMQAARFVVETDELKPKPRACLRDLLKSFE